jgi:hypothetical protein
MLKQWRLQDFQVHILSKIGFSGHVSGRSQWPRDLRHEPPSPATTKGSWVQIPLEAWMSVCVYCVFV